MIEDIFEKCKGWVNDFLALESFGRKGFDSVTPYMHCLVYHVPLFTKKYGKLLRFSGQGVEKINDDIKRKSSFKNKQMKSIILKEDFPKAFHSQIPSMTTNPIHLEYPFLSKCKTKRVCV
jgi:hypothetical protein